MATSREVVASSDRFEEAEGALRAARERASSTADERQVWRQLGFALEKQRKYAESIQAYEMAGDSAVAARVRENEATTQENASIEAENQRIEEMRREAERLEEELEKLEQSGGGG